MNAPDVLPWECFDPKLREAVKDLAGRFPAQMVADAAQRFADRMAEHGRNPDTNWVELGWRNETEHRDFVDQMRTRAERLPDDAQAAVKEHRRRLGIPDRGPYSTDQALAIDLLIEEAEHRNGERSAA